MSDNINELVKRLRAEEWATVEREKTRNAAADALEAMAGEVERVSALLRASRADEAELIRERDRLAGEVENLKHDIARHMTIANEAAAERDRLKAALQAIEQGDYYGCVSEFAAKALGGDAS